MKSIKKEGVNIKLKIDHISVHLIPSNIFQIWFFTTTILWTNSTFEKKINHQNK